MFLQIKVLSTTRDPFYSPGIDGEFGLILLKINIPKNKKELDYLLKILVCFHKKKNFYQHLVKFKLISKNENFKYYHINKDFEKN